MASQAGLPLGALETAQGHVEVGDEGLELGAQVPVGLHPRVVDRPFRPLPSRATAAEEEVRHLLDVPAGDQCVDQPAEAPPARPHDGVVGPAAGQRVIEAEAADDDPRPGGALADAAEEADGEAAVEGQEVEAALGDEVESGAEVGGVRPPGLHLHVTAGPEVGEHESRPQVGQFEIDLVFQQGDARQ